MNRSPTVERLLYMALAMGFLGMLAALFIVYAQLRSTGVVTREIQQAVVELKQDKTTKDGQVLDHINCIAQFLSQPKEQRVVARIEDIEDCKIVRE